MLKSRIVADARSRELVIGGGLGGNGFFDRVRAMILSRPEQHPDDLAIVPSALGDDAGLEGAARWLAAAR